MEGDGVTTTRETLIRCARAYLRESRARRSLHRAFSFTLLAWAGRCRREAAQAQPVQRDMFGGAA